MCPLLYHMNMGSFVPQFYHHRKLARHGVTSEWQFHLPPRVSEAECSRVVQHTILLQGNITFVRKINQTSSPGNYSYMQNFTIQPFPEENLPLGFSRGRVKFSLSWLFNEVRHQEDMCEHRYTHPLRTSIITLGTRCWQVARFTIRPSYLWGKNRRHLLIWYI